MVSTAQLKVGMIGAGTAGGFHAAAWQNVKGAKLVAIADISVEKADKLSGTYKITSSDNPDALITESEIDIIDICLPTPLHREYTLKAAENKKHVFCEKPIARTLKDAREMIDTCQKASIKFMVGHVLRFFHEFVKIKEQIDKGKIGKVGIVRTSRLSQPLRGWFREFDKSGGAVLDMTAHDFDWLRWCFGEVERVYARGLAYRKFEKYIDYALVTLRFENGVISHTESSWAETGGFNTAVEVAGDKGLIDFKSDEAMPIQAATKQTETGETGVVIPESPLAESPYTLELQHFVDSILKNKEPEIVTPEDAYKALEISLAALESIKTGEVIIL